MKEKARRVAGPATHPSCAIAHASDRTPDPITAVTMCALAVHTPPATIDHNIINPYLKAFLSTAKTCYSMKYGIL